MTFTTCPSILRRGQLKQRLATLSVILMVVAGGTTGAQSVTTYPFDAAQDSVTITHIDLQLRGGILAPNGGIQGRAEYTLAPKAGATRVLLLLDSVLTVDSVRFGTAVATYTHTGMELSIPLPALPAGLLRVFYHGPMRTEAAQFGGVKPMAGGWYNIGVAFNELPHNFNRTLYPCYDNFRSRSTYSIALDAPAGAEAIAGGTLDSIVNLDAAGTRRFYFSVHKSMPSYLIGMAVGNFLVERSTLNGLNGPIPYHLAVYPSDTTKFHYAFRNLQTALTTFENAYGPYPFENIGYVGVPLAGGAMEHAGNIAFPAQAPFSGLTNDLSIQRTMAHELAHAWWGNNVTCSRAEEMWLNEGWASFNEFLFLEAIDTPGGTLASAAIQTNHENVLNNIATVDNGVFPLNFIPQSHTYGMHAYNRGADVTRTLRAFIGDSAFFQGAKNYQSVYALDTANTRQLQIEMSMAAYNAAGFDLSVISNSVFNNWVYTFGDPDLHPGPVTYPTTRFPTATQIDLYQTRQHQVGFVPCQHMPVAATAVQANGTITNETELRFFNVDPTKSGWIACIAPALHFGNPSTVLLHADPRAGYATSARQINNPTGGVNLPLQRLRFTVNGTAGQGKTYVVTRHYTGAPHFWNTPGARYFRLSPMQSIDFFCTDTAEKALDASTEILFQPADHVPAVGPDTWIAPNADSMRLFHRYNTEVFREIPATYFYTGSGANRRVSRAVLPMLPVGTYAWGYYQGGLANPEAPAAQTTFTAYPNPTTGPVTLTFSAADAASAVLVIDVVGRTRILPISRTSSGSMQTDLSNMASGVYVLRPIFTTNPAHAGANGPWQTKVIVQNR